MLVAYDTLRVTSAYSFADISISGDNGDLSGKHNIGRTFDSINEGFTTPVEVVELRLGHRVVNIDCWNFQLALSESLIQMMNSGRGFFGKASDT
jgi:hypothetical protein